MSDERAQASKESNRGRVLGGIAAALVVVVAVVWIGWRRGGSAAARSTPPPPDPSLLAAPKKPKLPPKPGQILPRAREPVMPRPDRAALRAAYDEAKAAGRPPGEAAFRRMVHAFVVYNREFAEAQAAKEHITVAEVEELTYLGFMVMQTQSPSELEGVLGRALPDDERRQVASLMETHDTEFKQALRDLVAAGKPEADRWKLIHDTEAAYRRDLSAVTGLDDDQFDAILAGDILKDGAPIATQVPPDDQITPRPYVPDQPRPTTAPEHM